MICKLYTTWSISPNKYFYISQRKSEMKRKIRNWPVSGWCHKAF